MEIGFKVFFDENRYISDYEKMVEEAFNEVEDRLLLNISSGAPVLTGALRDSFYSSGELIDNDFSIISELPYAEVQDYYYNYVNIGIERTEQELNTIFSILR